MAGGVVTCDCGGPRMTSIALGRELVNSQLMRMSLGHRHRLTILR